MISNCSCITATHSGVFIIYIIYYYQYHNYYYYIYDVYIKKIYINFKGNISIKLMEVWHGSSVDFKSFDYNGGNMSRFFYGLYYVLCVWCGFKAQNFRFARTLFLFFF